MKGISVAFVGADGAGKSTVTRLVEERLGDSARRIYMGVNLAEADIALPTTRLALAAKRRRGGRPDLTGWHGGGPAPHYRPTARDTARILNLIAEEWYRALIVAYHKWRGRIVLMDRHFVADYWKHDISPDDPDSRSWLSRLHGSLLRRYPMPDHIVLLDAPPEMLHSRKAEATTEYLASRRAEYVDLGTRFGAFTTISAVFPLEEVAEQCVAVVDKVYASAQR